MKNRLLALIALLTLGVGAFLIAPVSDVGTVQPTAVASAGECDAAGTLCGSLKNNTNIAIGVIHSWGENYSRLLYPGQNSDSFWRDTDGLYIGGGSVLLCAPGGYCTREYGPKNIKITNVWSWQEWTVSGYRP